MLSLETLLLMAVAGVVFMVFFVSAYIFFVYRWSRPQSYYYKDRPFIFGHRGSPTKATENTIESFEESIKQGVDGLEFDIRLTKDKKIIIFHDSNLQRLLEVDLKIKDLNYSQLKQYYFKDKTSIPLLDEIVPLISKVRAINIEIKSEGTYSGHGVIGPLIKFLNTHNIDHKIVVSSFNPLILWRLKRKRPQTIIGFLYVRKKFFTTWDNLVWMMRLRPDNLHIHYSLLDSWVVRWARKKGMRINSYTINDKKVFDLAKIDGVFTDNIEYLK